MNPYREPAPNPGGTFEPLPASVPFKMKNQERCPRCGLPWSKYLDRCEYRLCRLTGEELDLRRCRPRHGATSR